MEVNRQHWNEVTPVHARSSFYDLDGFKAGKSTLMSIEREELGDVSGKSMLHLQCHFGLDTMSWARLGARITGVDFSEEAIELVRSLSRELDIEARFVLSNVYDLSDALDEEFDVVFTSYGVLPWLPDLQRWAGVVARFVRPGGTFYMVEGHPFLGVFDDESDRSLRVRYSYFGGEPTLWEPNGSYADRSATLVTPTYQFDHSFGELLNSLIDAGLRIEYVHEFPFCFYQALPLMEQGEDGWWRLPEHNESVPQTFSLKATRQ